MKTIEKKCWVEWFDDILSGKKKYDVRLGDDDIEEGDTLVLKEWDQNKNEYTGRQVAKKVTYAKVFKIDETFWPEQEIKEKGLRILSLE